MVGGPSTVPKFHHLLFKLFHNPRIWNATVHWLLFLESSAGAWGGIPDGLNTNMWKTCWNSWHDITPYQMICRVLYINIIMPIDVYSVRICLLITWWKEVHWRHTYLFICCPPNPVLLLEVLVHSEHQGGPIFHQKNIFHLPELSPCTTSNSNP